MQEGETTINFCNSCRSFWNTKPPGSLSPCPLTPMVLEFQFGPKLAPACWGQPDLGPRLPGGWLEILFLWVTQANSINSRKHLHRECSFRPLDVHLFASQAQGGFTNDVAFTPTRIADFPRQPCPTPHEPAAVHMTQDGGKGLTLLCRRGTLSGVSKSFWGFRTVLFYTSPVEYWNFHTNHITG